MATRSYWTRIRRGRITRRRLIGTAGVGAAGLAVAAACGGGGGGTDADGTPAVSGTPAGTPVSGGRYQTKSSASFDTIDPHASIAATSYFARIYNVLVKQSARDSEFIFNDLAESFEVPDEGGTEWIFTIRPGVKIAPNDLGVPERDIDAEDARVTYDRIRHGGEEGGPLPNANSCAFVCNWLESDEVPDPLTYIWRTPKPYAWFLLQIGGTQFWQSVVPRELIQQDPDRLKSSGVGGGPFSVVGFAEGEFLTMDANPNYYRTDPDNDNAQLPYIDGWDVTVVPDRTAIRTAFLSKQAYGYTAANSEEADELLAQYDIYAGARNPVFSFISFAMNVERSPWDIPEIRKAAMYAINRQEYVEKVYLGDAQVNGLVHWPVGSYALPPEELEQLQPYDPERSKQLIRDAGFDLPLEIEVVFPTPGFIEGDKHLPIFLKQMEDAGFKVIQKPMTLGEWIVFFRERKHGATLNPNLAYETPEFPLDFQHSNGPFGNGELSIGLNDPEIDAAIDATKEITDSEELVTAIHEVQRDIYAKGPAVLPFVSPFTRTLYWNFVKNFPTTRGTADLLLNNWWLDGAPS